MQNIKTFLANLSQHPGVYQMLDEKGKIIYIGKAKNLKKRVSSYFSTRVQDLKTIALVKQIHDIVITVTRSENEAVLLECNLIKTHKPRYNVLLRDDKSYPYILISHHAFPRIDSYRGTRRKHADYFGPYPSSLAVRETIHLLQKLFKLRTCRDAYYDARSRPCLLYQIERCTAPCVGLIEKDEYAKSVKLAELFLTGKSNEVIASLQAQMEAFSHHKEFENAAVIRDQITRLRQIQEKQYISINAGDADVIGLATQAGIACLQLLTIRKGQILASQTYYPSTPANSSDEEIISAFIAQHYLHDLSHVEAIPSSILIEETLSDLAILEEVLTTQSKRKVTISAPQRGEKRKWLDMAKSSAKDSLAAHLLNKANMRERMHDVEEVLNMPQPLTRMECFDISHSSGEATVASCVVFDLNGPLKRDYRRYNIHDITPGDDVAAMRQVISRRFKRSQEEGLLPDLILIDGGTTQLAAARAALDELGIHQVFLASVSKGPGRKAGFESIHIENKTAMHLPATSAALHCIQHIRDEAHRFAIMGHRAKRDKARRQSVLESIPGIGAKRRRELLRYFGGIQGIACASLEEISKVPGISLSLAERIFATLHD